MILIISSEADEHATAVREQLADGSADVRLLDLSEFPTRLGLSINYGRDDGHSLSGEEFGHAALADCAVAWWRRPQPFELHPDVTERADYRFAYTECKSAIDGLWLLLDAFWVNDPIRDDAAARKVHQLNVARTVGFEVPATCVTNDPGDARAFVEELAPDPVVYKAFSATPEAWRETRILREEETELLDSVRYAPVIFQEYVPAGVDLRVTVVGDDVFPAAIHSQETSYRADFRMTMDEARMEAVDLPADVLDLVRAFMDELGLVYGAIDMRRTPDGEYVFLEINPSGQWLFVEERTGQPITEAFADLLAANA